MSVKEGYKYTKDHEWINKNTGGEIVIGISDFAQGELGEVVFVDLPKIGKTVKKGDVLCVVESTKAASDVYAPITGEVVAVNDSLSKEPALINSAPYEAGWLVQLKAQDEEEIAGLMNDQEYKMIVEK